MSPFLWLDAVEAEKFEGELMPDEVFKFHLGVNEPIFVARRSRGGKI